MLDTQQIMQKINPKVTKLPTKIEGKGGDIRTLPIRITQQPQEALCCPQNLCYPPFSVPPSVRLPPKPPDTDETNTDSH